MVLYLRDAKGNDLVDLEFWTKCEDGQKVHEIRVVVPIVPYSMFLIGNKEKQANIIAAFGMLDELRGWLWESYYATKRNNGSDEDYTLILAHLRKVFNALAEDLNIRFVED